MVSLSVKREYDDGRLEYEVKFWVDTTEYEYTVDGATGDIRKSEREPHPSASSADIGQDQAVSIALAHAGLSQSQVYGLEAEREWEDDHLEYQVEFKAGGMGTATTLPPLTVPSSPLSVRRTELSKQGARTDLNGPSGLPCFFCFPSVGIRPALARRSLRQQRDRQGDHPLHLLLHQGAHPPLFLLRAFHDQLVVDLEDQPALHPLRTQPVPHPEHGQLDDVGRRSLNRHIQGHPLPKERVLKLEDFSSGSQRRRPNSVET